jgi:hypothetical protein
VALVGVSAAGAKAVPRLSKTVAAPGELVTVDFGPGATHYLAPLEVYLVRVSVEPEITGRHDPRLRLVGKLGRVHEPIRATKLRFRVPRIAAGRYTLAAWFEGTETYRWHNLAEGLWRDATFKDHAILRIVRRSGRARKTSTGVAAAPASSPRARTVPCSESIDGTRFPYIGSNRRKDRYRLVLDAISVPPAYRAQVVHNGTERWPYFFKAGLVIRASGESVVVTVPQRWRDRVAIAWGFGGKGVFGSLRFHGCNALPSQGFAYSGGFYLRAPACIPLTFRVGHRSATAWFGLGRRCRA